MPTRRRPFDPAAALLRAYAAGAGVNQFLVDALDPAIWRAPVPAKRGKTIAQLVAHLHNCGLRYLERTDPSAPVPAELDRHRVTQSQASRAVAAKRRVVLDVVGTALRGDGRIVGFPFDAAHYLAYYMVHDAHHRGQIAMMARLLGSPLSRDVMAGMWQWSARARE